MKLAEDLDAVLAEVEEARFELSRHLLDLVTPRPTQTLGEIVKEAIKEYQDLEKRIEEFEDHDCEEECGCDEDELSFANREIIRNVISDLGDML